MNWPDGAARVVASQRPDQLGAGRHPSGTVPASPFQRAASNLAGPRSAPAGPQQPAADALASSGPRRGLLAVRSGHRVCLAYRNKEELR
jgi:hypothetical protein